MAEKAEYAFLGMDAMAGIKNAEQLTRLKTIHPKVVSGDEEVRKRMRADAIALMKSAGVPPSLVEKAKKEPIEELDRLLEEALVERGRIKPGELWRELRRKTNTKLEEV